MQMVYAFRFGVGYCVIPTAEVGGWICCLILLSTDVVCKDGFNLHGYFILSMKCM
jgi:hypothetical protein